MSEAIALPSLPEPLPLDAKIGLDQMCSIGTIPTYSCRIGCLLRTNGIAYFETKADICTNFPASVSLFRQANKEHLFVWTDLIWARS